MKNNSDQVSESCVFFWIDRIVDISSAAFGIYETDPLEHGQMMRYQVLLDAQSFYDFADTEGFVSSEETDDLDPVWLREDIEGFLEEIYIIRIGEAEIIH